MDNGETYRLSGNPTGNFSKTVKEFEHDTTPQEQPEERRHPCRGCLEYYDIGCMRASRGSSDGICKTCASEYDEEYHWNNRDKKHVQNKEYNAIPENYARRKEYMKEYGKKYHQKNRDKRLAQQKRNYCKKVLLKMIHKDLYADLWEGGISS